MDRGSRIADRPTEAVALPVADLPRAEKSPVGGVRGQQWGDGIR
jgi:hypothetical protein